MTVTAPQPDPDARERASDSAVAVVGGGGRSGPVRRLRVAPPVQLELVCGRQGPPPEVVWASLPEPAREAVLGLLARLIGAGAVEQEGER